MNKVDAKKKQERQEIEDRIVDRILINFGIGIAAYIYLWMLHKNNLPTTLIFISAAVFAVLAIACFVVGKMKSKTYIPYGIMFSCFSVGALIIKSSYLVSYILGMNKFVELMTTSEAAMKLLNGTNNVKFVAACGGVYLAVMLIINIVLLIKSKR